MGKGKNAEQIVGLWEKNLGERILGVVRLAKIKTNLVKSMSFNIKGKLVQY